MDSAKVHDRRWAILGVLVVSLLVVVLDNTILNVALPTIERTLHASQSQQEWMVDSYTLVFAGLLFTWGVLGDRYGRKRILMLGLALFGAASLASAYSTSPEMLIAMRALMGIGGAAVLPATLSIITNVFEPAERGKAIGIWAGATGIAVAIGPITGGALLQAGFWWGSVFLVNVPVVIVGVIAVGMLVPESKDPRPLRLDVLGVLLSIAGLMTLVYGIIKGGQLNDWTSPLVLGALLGGIAIVGLFVVRERSSDHPILDVSLFRNPTFSAASAAITLNFFALFGAMFYLTFYLQFVRGYDPLQAGVRVLPVAPRHGDLRPQVAGVRPPVRREGSLRRRDVPGDGSVPDVPAYRSRTLRSGCSKCCCSSRASAWPTSSPRPRSRSCRRCPARGPARARRSTTQCARSAGRLEWPSSDRFCPRRTGTASMAR